MRAKLLVLVFVFVSLSASFASADLLSLLSTPPNSVNDVLQDRSWGIGLADPNLGVVYGLAAFDNVTVEGTTYQTGRTSWFVFSVTASSAVQRTFNDVMGPLTLSGFDHQATIANGYKLTDLLPGWSISPNALIVLIDGVDYGATTYLKTLQNDTAATKSLVDNAIAELASQGKLVATFGLVDQQDFFFVEVSGSGSNREFMGLSVVDVATGVNPMSFRPLFAEADERVDLTKFEFSLRDFANVTTKKLNPETGVYAWYTDRATALVNYVPEPTSVVALLGLGSVALASYVARRRKS